MYDYYKENNSTVDYEIVPYTAPRKSNNFARITAAACMVAVFAGTSFGLGLGASGLLPGNRPAAVVEQTVAGAEYTTGTPAVELAQSDSGISFINTTRTTAIGGVVDVVKQSASSVVSINVSGTARTVFNRLMPVESAGSGIVIGEDSDKLYIATNNHVISNASNVTVSVDDSNQVAANYVGSDYESDLAVISVTKEAMSEAGVTGYKIASTGNSDALEVGEIVIAIGNALGEGKTATMGIVSAKEKEINIENRTIKVLQTDAAINPGNSGGALVNMNAEVIGINTAKLSEVGVEGMGYSIPINEAMVIIDGLIKNSATATQAKPYLGIQGVDVDEETRAENNLQSVGVYVYSVFSGSGAEAAGLRRGDIITGFGDKQIISMNDLTNALAESKVGETIDLTIYRNGSETTVKVVLKDANQKF